MQKATQIFKFPCLLVLLLFSIACSDDEPVVVENPEIRVVGFWKSSTSSGASFNVSVSSVLTETDGVYAGPFFITSNFSPAFGSNNDGSISFKVEEDRILNFSYIDTIPGCEGSFTGVGEVNSDGGFFITFTGTDCDEFHNGTISLEQ